MSMNLQNPTNKTYDGLSDILNYVKETWEIGLSMKKAHQGKFQLFGFCDASYNPDGDGYSRLGGCFYVSPDSCAIESFSKKDHTVSHSSTEAELKAIDLSIRTIEMLRDQLEELGHSQDRPTVLFVDNRSAIEIGNTMRSKNNLKHINKVLFYIRKMINTRVVELCFVRTEENVADMLTKPLAHDQFVRMRDLLMNGISISELDRILQEKRVRIHNKFNSQDHIFVG